MGIYYGLIGKSGGQKMSETRTMYDEDFKKNVVKLSYASPKTGKREKFFRIILFTS
jgi:hypothetical protein